MVVYVLASYAVYGIFAFLVAVAVWAWVVFDSGRFTSADTAFLDAEATLLLASAAVLVIVFEIEKARKERLKELRLRTAVRRMRKGSPPPRENS